MAKEVITGAEALMRSLQNEGVKTIFGYPGGTIMPVFDALYSYTRGENKLFDQSIVGIFPKDESLTYYLLAFFNSPTCNKLIRTINPSANNPANYIKKIPFIIPEKSVLELITAKTKSIVDEIRATGSYDEKKEREIWELIEGIYKV